MAAVPTLRALVLGARWRPVNVYLQTPPAACGAPSHRRVGPAPGHVAHQERPGRLRRPTWALSMHATVG